VSLSRTQKILIGAFAVNGVVHLAKPEVYEPIMPSWVPRHREVIVGSGYAELALAAGLALPWTRKPAGWASIALLLAVYPANIKMATDAAKGDNKPMLVATLARLPLQLPMIKAAYDATKASKASKA
jgi:uncharacterized membrane protein